MPEFLPPSTPPDAAPWRSKWPALMIVIFLAGAGAYLHFAHRGLAEGWKDSVLAWTHDNPNLTPLLLAGLYIVCGLLLLPVWWVQLLAGTCLGLVYGTLLCAALAAFTAGVSAAISRSTAREWFEKRIEARLGKMQTLAEKTGAAGVRAVLVVRLTHVIPFGISNYAFGLLGLRRRDVVAGTLLGSLPAIAFYAAIGAGKLTNGWKTIAALAGFNALLLTIVWLTSKRAATVRKRSPDC